jgi:hypothetical protein
MLWTFLSVRTIKPVLLKGSMESDLPDETGSCTGRDGDS